MANVPFVCHNIALSVVQMFWGMSSVVNGKGSVHCETRERVKAIRKGNN